MEKEFDCSECDKSFELFYQRKEHLKKEHDIFHPNVLEWQCMICGMPYGEHENMVECYNSHDNEKKETVEARTDDLI